MRVYVMHSCRWLLIVLLAFLSGCATGVAPLDPLPQVELSPARSRFEHFLLQQTVAFIDADVKLHWDVFGHKGSADGMLLMRAPGYMRLTIVDPLGRSLFIAVTDGKSFTLVDNRQGKAYKGRTNCDARYQFLPDVLQTNELFSLVSGGIKERNFSRESVGWGEDKEKIWYQLRRLNGTGEERVVLNDAGTALTDRYLIEDDRKDIVITYSGVASSKEGYTPWPSTVTFSGDAIDGHYQIDFTNIVPRRSMPISTFFIKVPPGFQITEVQ